MSDDDIKKIFTRYGRTVTGHDYALVRATAEAVASPRTWVELTDEEMKAVVDAQPLVSNINVYFKAIEAKLKEKNYDTAI